MNTTLFLSLFAILGVIYFILGLIASRNIKTTTDYFLAGRNLGLISVASTLIATQLGGGMLLGTSQQAYDVGFYGIFYTLSMSLGFILLGLGFAAKLQALNVTTTAELFETVYGSPALKKVASILSIMTLCGILIGQIVAARSLMFGLGFGNELLLILFWAGVIIYTMVGGLKAIVVTDIFQVGFIVLIFTGIFIYALMTEPGSFFSFNAMAETQTLFSSSRITFAGLLGVALMPALYSLIEQDLAQRFFAARSKKVAVFSAIAASIFLISFSLIPIYFGIKARMLDLPVTGSPMMPVIGYIAGNFFLALAACAIVAAITSTADSLLCAISSNISEDFAKQYVKGRNELRLSQVVTLIVGIFAIFASYYVSEDIISVMVGSYELSVCCLLVPLLFSYFKKKLKKEAAIGAISLGLLGFVIFRVNPVPFREIIALLMSLAGYFIGSFVGSRK